MPLPSETTCPGCTPVWVSRRASTSYVLMSSGYGWVTNVVHGGAMTRIAVTGGSGKAGRAVVRDLLEHGHQVLNLDLVPSPESSGPDSPAPFLAADLTDFGQTL